MPILFAPFVGIALGAALAWIAAPELVRDRTPLTLSRSFLVVAAFAGLLWLPVVGYFLMFHGDWSYLYLFPWKRVPSAVDLLLVLLSAGVVVGGFAAAVRPVRTQRMRPILAMVAGPAAVVAVGLVASSRRLAVSATYAQFRGDFGVEPIGASTLGKGVLWMGALLVVGLAWTLWALLGRGGVEDMARRG